MNLRRVRRPFSQPISSVTIGGMYLRGLGMKQYPSRDVHILHGRYVDKRVSDQAQQMKQLLSLQIDCLVDSRLRSDSPNVLGVVLTKG